MTPDATASPAAFDLSGKVAIVTGSSRGIGLGIARALREAGASVMGNARSAASPPGAFAGNRQESRLAFHAADVSTRDGAERLVAATLDLFGRLDIVVNNAGIQPSGPWAEADDGRLDTVLRANVKSVEHMARAALPALCAAGGGAAIVNIASVRAARPGARMAHYGLSKAAVVALTRALAAELGPRGVRVNAISPGLVERPGIAESWPEGVARFRGDAPLGRLGTPADIGHACVFLASAASGWITGIDLVVDGGITLVR